MILFQKKEKVSDEDIEYLLNVFSKIQSNNIWSKVKDRNDFVVKRFDEGYVNDICSCVLTEYAKNRLKFTDNDPEGVVVKIFANQLFPLSEAVNRALIHLSVSNANLGPKLIYMDLECSVNEFINDGRQHLYEDDLDEQLLENIFRLLARYHHLEVPITSRCLHWGDSLELFKEQFTGASDVLNGKILEFLKNDSELCFYKETFEKMKFKNMFEYFPKASHTLNSSVVFCHLDFHRANRLISVKKSSDESEMKQFYFIDLDTSMYNYRGFDFGAFFLSYLQKEYDSMEEIASDEKLLEFIEIYRQESSLIKGHSYLEDEHNCSSKILREAKFFIIYYFFIYNFFCFAMFCQDPLKERSRQFLKAVFVRYPIFEKLRNQYKQEGILPDIGIDIW